MFGSVGTPELLLILFIILLVFGKNRLPGLARGLGKAVRQFKNALDDVKEELNIDEIKKDLKG